MPHTYYRRFLNDGGNRKIKFNYWTTPLGGGGGGGSAISTVMKIDRLSGKYLITNLDETENFVGTGS